MKNLGDSGTFGSQKQMDSMYRANKASSKNSSIMKPTPAMPAYKKGGKVKKTGVALVHKGEVVIPKNKVKVVKKVIKKTKTGSQMLKKAMKPFKK